MTKPQLVIVDWLDAWTDELGVTLENVGASHKPMKVKTIGWLLKEDDVGVSLANEHFDDGTYRGRTFILHCMVERITPYGLTKPRGKRGRKASQVQEESQIPSPAQ